MQAVSLQHPGPIDWSGIEATELSGQKGRLQTTDTGPVDLPMSGFRTSH